MPKKTPWTGVVEPGIRKHAGPHGERWYRVQMGRRGKGNRRSKVCTTLEAAIALKREWEADGIPRAEAEPPPPDVEPTVEDALRLYAIGRPHVARAVRYTAGTLARSYPDLLAMPVAAVTPDHFALYRAARERAGQKPSSVATCMGCLRAAVRYARPEFSLPKGLLPALDLTRHKTLTPAELQRGLLATPEPIATMARLALLTFMRQGEIRTLQRAAIDYQAQTISLARAKKGPRVVAFDPAAAKLLRAQCARHTSDLVFPSVGGRPYGKSRVSGVWHQAMVLIGRPDFSFHDLRHHAAMTALADGASFPELQALGGWKRPDMVNRYATATNDRLRTLQGLAARRLAGHRRHA